MSFDIPVTIESQVLRFANEQHISNEEAVVKLIEAGLERMLPSPVSPQDILGAFSSPSESALVDDALELAMGDRERRNNFAPHA